MLITRENAADRCSHLYCRARRLAAALLCVWGCASGPGGEGGASELAATVARYDSAWNAKDTAAVGAMLSPSYRYFSSTGRLSDRAATLRLLQDTGYVLTGATRTEVDIALVDGMGRVSSRWQGEGRYRGDPIRDDQTCGQTWLRRDGRWWLVTEHCANRPRPDSTAGGG
jgi:hypothetical protein